MKDEPISEMNRLYSIDVFSSALFNNMKLINPGINGLELYEFRYGLDNMVPEDGWESVIPEEPENIERLIGNRDFYLSIQLKPRSGDRIVLDNTIVHLNRMLFVGLVSGEYSAEWIRKYFYFDIRGFYFLPRTKYFSDAVIAHFGGKPYKRFEQMQKRFESFYDVGYMDFKEANAEIDQAFIGCMMQMAETKGTPLIISLAGPTAAGKTEIINRLQQAFIEAGKKITTIEMDNFLIDRDDREKKPMGRDTVHFELFIQSLQNILAGKKAAIPRYDFIRATSSHNVDGSLRKGCTPIEVEPSDIIFLEGNFPFHIRELADLITLKVVYLTDDPIRLKRKWRRDLDLRKKYDPAYFMNRFFQTQFMRAEDCYRPLMEICDMVVDTTAASLWVTPQLAPFLGRV